jgi:hypothetical protein
MLDRMCCGHNFIHKSEFSAKSLEIEPAFSLAYSIFCASNEPGTMSAGEAHSHLKRADEAVALRSLRITVSAIRARRRHVELLLNHPFNIWVGESPLHLEEDAVTQLI